MSPLFIINTLSETVAKKGSKLAPQSHKASTVFDDNIFDNLDHIVNAGRKAGWVVIEGGDGTAQGIITAFFNLIDNVSDMPKFTLLPGGMTNQVAKNIGLKKLTAKSIETLLGGKRTESKTPLLKVSCKEHPDLYGFLFSTGGVPMVTQYTKDKLHSKGIGGSSAVVGGIIKGISGRDDKVLKPSEISIKIDNKIQSGEHLGTLVTTLPSLLLGLDPFWGEGDGALRMTYVDGTSKHLASHLAGLWMGRKNKNRSADGLHSFNASSLIYDYNGPIVLDGEPLTLSPNFTVSPTLPLTFIS